MSRRSRCGNPFIGLCELLREAAADEDAIWRMADACGARDRVKPCLGYEAIVTETALHAGLDGRRTAYYWQLLAGMSHAENWAALTALDRRQVLAAGPRGYVLPTVELTSQFPCARCRGPDVFHADRSLSQGRYLTLTR